MILKAFAFACIAFAYAQPSSAIVISKDYIFSPDVIGVFERKVKWALHMRPGLPDETLYAQITDEIGLACEKGFPTAAGEGCKVMFFLKSDLVSVTLVKKTAAFGFAERVVQKLAQLSPATQAEGEHVQFGSPFQREDGDGTHYYCQPVSNEKGVARWKCTLHVSEEF